MSTTYLKNKSDYEKLLISSQKKKVFLLKHSTQCDISANAIQVYNRFKEEQKDFNFWIILVIKNRNLSQYIAKENEVIHKSPQVLLFLNKKVVWNASHFQITSENLKKSLLIKQL